MERLYVYTSMVGYTNVYEHVFIFSENYFMYNPTYIIYQL